MHKSKKKREKSLDEMAFSSSSSFYKGTGQHASADPGHVTSSSRSVFDKEPLTLMEVCSAGAASAEEEEKKAAGRDEASGGL